MPVMPVSSVQFGNISCNNVSFEGRKKEIRRNEVQPSHVSMPLKSIPVIALIAASPIDAGAIKKFYPVDEPVRVEMVQSQTDERMLGWSAYIEDNGVYRRAIGIDTDGRSGNYEKIVVGTYKKDAGGNMVKLYDTNIDTFEHGSIGVASQIGIFGKTGNGTRLFWQRAIGSKSDGTREVFENKKLCDWIWEELRSPNNKSSLKIKDVQHDNRDLRIAFDNDGMPVFVSEHPEFAEEFDVKTLPSVSLGKQPELFSSIRDNEKLYFYVDNNNPDKYNVTFKRDNWPELQMVNFCKYVVRPVVEEESQAETIYVMSLKAGDGKIYNYVMQHNPGRGIQKLFEEIGDISVFNMSYMDADFTINP